jgi:uncharacterized protein (TIGR02001 family)
MAVLGIQIFSGLLRAEFVYRVDLTSRYIWRGFDRNPQMNPALQPSFEYSCGDCGFTLDFWSSISFESRDYHEIDLRFTYDFRVSESFSLNAGFVFYGWYFAEDFSFRENLSYEIFASVGLPKLFFRPRMTFFYDFGNGDGFYLLFDGCHIQRLSNKWRIDLTASLGYNGGQWLEEGAGPGFSDLNLGLALRFKSGRLVFSPFARYTFVLLDAIGTDDHFWYGISVIFK